MKTHRSYTIMMLILAFLFAITLKASTFLPANTGSGFAMINPPGTEVNSLSLIPLTEPVFEEESYINDIPFNTECVSKNCIYQKAIRANFELEEESYVDDIPFDTKSISVENSYKAALNEVFNFEDEEEVNDIPFDTYSIANNAQKKITELVVGN